MTRRAGSRLAMLISLVQAALERLAICACGYCPTTASIEATDLLSEEEAGRKRGVDEEAPRTTEEGGKIDHA